MHNSSNETAEMVEFFTPQETVIYNATTASLMVFGTLSNTAMIVFYIKRNKVKNHFNYCVVQLCVSNIVQYIGFIPYAFVDVRQTLQNASDVENHLFCTLKDGITVFFIAAFTSGYILCYMSYARYQIIKNPLKKFTYTLKRARRTIIGSWVLSFFLFIPNLFSLKWFSPDPYCSRTYPFGEQFFGWFAVIAFLAGFYLPLLFMSIAYIMTICNLCCTRNQIETNQVRIRHRRHILVVLGALVFIFVLCWLPVSAIWLLSSTGYFDKTTVEGNILLTRFYKVMLEFALLAGVLNFISNVLAHLSHRRTSTRRKLLRYEMKAV